MEKSSHLELSYLKDISHLKSHFSSRFPCSICSEFCCQHRTNPSGSWPPPPAKPPQSPSPFPLSHGSSHLLLFNLRKAKNHQHWRVLKPDLSPGALHHAVVCRSHMQGSEDRLPLLVLSLTPVCISNLHCSPVSPPSGLVAYTHARRHRCTRQNKM